MEKNIITKLKKSFEESAYQENGIEYWLARDLQVLLEYAQWRNIESVIEKAKIACKNAGQNVDDHFADVSKMVATETELSKNIYERGVDDQGFGRIRSKGDQALFGGLTTIQIKKKLNIVEKRPLADFLPTITIKAKDLATEITNFNVKKNDLYGERPITHEHIKNNNDVRGVLAKSGIKPEELPPEDDIKKLERRVKSDEKRLGKTTGRLNSKNKDARDG